MGRCLKGNMGYQWVIVALLWFSHTAYYLNFMTVGTLAPFIQNDLALTSAQIGFLTSALTIGSMLIQIPSGLLVDRFGPRWIMVLGLILVSATSFLISFYQFYPIMFILLVFLGIGIGANQTPATKAIIMWFPSKGRATGMGIKQTGVNMGGILAPLLLPAVAIHFQNWSYSYLFASLIAVVAVVLVFSLYKDAPETVFVRAHWEKTSWNSLRSLLTDIDFLLLCSAGILLMVAQFVFSTYFMLYAVQVLRLPLTRCGSLLALAFVSGAGGRIVWSVTSDYLLKGKRDKVIIVLAIVGVFSSLMLILGPNMPQPLIYIAVIGFGFSSLGWSAIYYTAVGEYPPVSMTGTAAGISFVITSVGAILGPPAFGYLRDITGNYKSGWVFTTLCLCAVVMLVKLKKKDRMAQV